MTVREALYILDAIHAGRDVTGLLVCHVCSKCGGRGVTWDRTHGTRTCSACNGTGSGRRDLS